MIYHGLRVLSDPRFYTSLPVCGREVHAAERLKLCKHEKLLTDLVRGCSFVNTGKVENFHVHVNFNLQYVNLDLHSL